MENVMLIFKKIFLVLTAVLFINSNIAHASNHLGLPTSQEIAYYVLSKPVTPTAILEYSKLYATSGELGEVQKVFNENKIDMNSVIDIKINGDKITLYGKEFSIKGRDIFYNGKVFSYNSTKTFDQNFLNIQKLLSEDSNWSLNFSLINTAHAASKDGKKAAILLAGGVVLMIGALVASASLPAVVLGTLVIGGVAALAAGMYKALTGKSIDVKDFDCTGDKAVITTLQGNSISIFEKDGVLYASQKYKKEYSEHMLNKKDTEDAGALYNFCKKISSSKTVIDAKKAIKDLNQRLTKTAAPNKNSTKAGK